MRTRMKGSSSRSAPECSISALRSREEREKNPAIRISSLCLELFPTGEHSILHKERPVTLAANKEQMLGWWSLHNAVGNERKSLE
mmetsp:Transcript_21899/g.31747  ORF Transcript_21899/g.31747 Transcript_21899/m.31747 type:complete len:85 (+) Transcript_21899:618-872(+)